MKNNLIVKTQKGLIHGKSQNNLRVFLGIPYTQAPVNNLRWQAPQDPKPWKNILMCTEFGPGCPQLTSPTGHGIPWTKTNEDCLTLNIWTPTKNYEENLPVMVWIHGGAFVSGGSSLPLYNGANLAKKGVIVVSINYRLGPLGFIYNSKLNNDPNNLSGNYGLLDQIKALKWVKDNINNFGGNPNSVTIFGESAGAFCISRLLISPLTKGLFHKAIIESGGFFGDRFWYPSTITSQESAQNAWNKISKKLGCDKSENEILLMHQKKAKEILNAANPGIDFLSSKTAFGPFTDNNIIPINPEEIFKKSNQHDIPIIIGNNKDEGNLFIQNLPFKNIKQYELALHFLFGHYANKLMKIYPVKNNNDIKIQLNNVITELNFTAPTNFIAKSYKNKKSKAFVYNFSYIPPTKLGKKLGSHHGAEINYVFGNLDAKDGFSKKDKILSEQIMDYWINFAKTGDPNNGNLPNWPDCNSDNKIIELSDNLQIRSGINNQVYEIANSLWNDPKIKIENKIKKIFLLNLIKHKN